MDNEILQNFIDDWLKGVQEIADSIAPDPGADNSMLSLASLPYRFDTYAYGSYSTNRISDGYDRASYGWGLQDWLCKFRVTLYNNTLVIPSVNFMGRHHGDSWQWFTDAEIELLQSKFEEILDKGFEVLNNYPASDILIKYTSPRIISFQPALHSESDITVKAPIKNNEYLYTAKTGVNFQYSDSPVTEEDGTITINYGSVTPSNGWQISSKGYVLMVLDSDADAYNLVDNVFSSTSTNNDVINYTKAGSEYKLYYGDNYLIFALSSANIYNFTDLFSGTKDAADNYNTWFPDSTPIHTPTYDECKYGPPPPPPEDPDDDIEVEMNLNDAAFGEGLSHYYVTTVDAPVLSDISEAMSSWNINNTGKDLYRNLLSCRITKVGPIPSSPSTFVIYGEELLHGGSPITISKITGNPSMDLGEYEILPKFNDFRDYAPYTKIEMFIPYCGWVALPSHCMSSEEAPKIITGTLLCDIIAGTCKAVIKCNDTVVAEASGFTAVDVPFTGENVGMKMAGIASAITSYGNAASKTVGNIASGGLSGGAGAGAATAGGLVGLLGSYAQLHSAFNANYTEICGKTGDGCNVAGLNKVYIKIQRPKTGGYEAPDFVPEDYGHTTGFIAMKKKQISECEGLIVCANPDTSGIGGATDRERQMIKNLLESGIIVRHTEPEP